MEKLSHIKRLSIPRSTGNKKKLAFLEQPKKNGVSKKKAFQKKPFHFLVMFSWNPAAQLQFLLCGLTYMMMNCIKTYKKKET